MVWALTCFCWLRYFVKNRCSHGANSSVLLLVFMAVPPILPTPVHPLDCQSHQFWLFRDVPVGMFHTRVPQESRQHGKQPFHVFSRSIPADQRLHSKPVALI